jgi:hypothetical protein
MLCLLRDALVYNKRTETRDLQELDRVGLDEHKCSVATNALRGRVQRLDGHDCVNLGRKDFICILHHLQDRHGTNAAC